MVQLASVIHFLSLCYMEPFDTRHIDISSPFPLSPELGLLLPVGLHRPSQRETPCVWAVSQER